MSQENVELVQQMVNAWNRATTTPPVTALILTLKSK